MAFHKEKITIDGTTYRLQSDSTSVNETGDYITITAKSQLQKEITLVYKRIQGTKMSENISKKIKHKNIKSKSDDLRKIQVGTENIYQLEEIK